MQKPVFTPLQKSEILERIDIRSTTIQDDPESATEFENEKSLSILHDKITSGNMEFTRDETQWIIEELEDLIEIAESNRSSQAFTIQVQGTINSLNQAIGKLDLNSQL